jgi:hypothetical protein
VSPVKAGSEKAPVEEEAHDRGSDAGSGS